MAVAYSAVAQPGLLSQQYRPPLLPKPGKDNVKLQKLLKRTAKKKISTQASQSTTLFRSSLSPVNEASPDLEHSDHSTPPKTPETPFSLIGVQQAPRFTARPLYQHVASPYPQRASYGRDVRLSPQMVAMPSQHVTTFFSYSATAHLFGVSSAQGAVATIPSTSSAHEATELAAEVKKPTLSTFSETHAGFGPAAAEVTLQPKHSPGATPATAGQAFIRPLTVLTPFVKSRSPRPTFKATEPSRSPKPMFEVPQIRMYTASTSYYETSKTPPVYDSAGLTAIGSTIAPSKTPTEIKPDLTQPLFLGTDTNRKTTLETKQGTPTPEMNTIITPTIEIKRATPTSENIRATPTSEIKRATPTSEIKRASPTSEIKGASPTSDIKRAKLTSEIKRAKLTSEIRAKTPTYELQIIKTSTGRSKTPAYHITRAATPVFEISKPNPLLFAVSPITVQPERSRTPQTVSAISITEPKPTETMLSHSDMILAAEPSQQSVTKSKSEADLMKENIETTTAASQRLSKIPASEPTTPEVTSYGNQRPKTPTYEASRLMTVSPGYKRSRTPTFGTSSSGVSPVAFQRPKTPTQVAKKSSYRGLTPAEYAAYGGIKTYSPAFGISTSMMQTEEEVKEADECKTLSQEPSMKELSIVEMSKVKEIPNDEDKPQEDAPSVPTIIVSQTDNSGTTVAQEMSVTCSQVAAKTVEQTPEEQTVETPVQEVVKPTTKTSEAKRPLQNIQDQDPLKVVRQHLGKDKAQAARQKSGIETKAAVSDYPELAGSVTVTETEDKSSKVGTVVPARPVNVSAAVSTRREDKGKDKTSESAQSAPEKKEGDESLPAAEPLLKVIQKPKGMKSKMSGWSRLKKHMVVEQKEPTFPVAGSQNEDTEQDHSGVKEVDMKADELDTLDEKQTEDPPKATKMWDAVLFQMFSTKENIMHQIEINKSQDENEHEKKDELKEIPSFAYRLPVLLFSPKFDAKKLKEAASRPVTKISTVFEMGLIGRKCKDEEPKDFNRKARGFAAT